MELDMSYIPTAEDEALFQAFVDEFFPEPKKPTPERKTVTDSSSGPTIYMNTSGVPVAAWRVKP